MEQVDSRRAVIERLVRKSREEAALRGKRIDTVDPIIKVGRRLYPYFSDQELHNYACTALRLVLRNSELAFYQTTLVAFLAQIAQAPC